MSSDSSPGGSRKRKWSGDTGGTEAPASPVEAAEGPASPVEAAETPEEKKASEALEEKKAVEEPEEKASDAPEEKKAAEAPEEKKAADAPEEKKAAEAPEEKKAVAAPLTKFDEAYFRYYADVRVQQHMIKDHIITETYKAAISNHRQYIKDKVVVDVGCGTGILSVLCARAGAKRVYAVEASDIAVQAKEVVKANNLDDKIIVLHGRVEDVQIDEEVDVIISEWMGHMLFFENMLGSVITARDRWLKRGGVILPSNASLKIAPVTNPDKYHDSVDFWRIVHEIDMSAMMPLAKQCAFKEPMVEAIGVENVMSWPADVLIDVDCYTLQLQKLETLSGRFKFSSPMRAPLHGFAFWFNVQFGGPQTFSSNFDSIMDENDPPVLSTAPGDQGTKRTKHPYFLSTAPGDPLTHWKQTLIYLDDPLEVEQGQVFEGSVTLSSNKENHRFMNVHLEYITLGRSFVREFVMRCSVQDALLVRK